MVLLLINGKTIWPFPNKIEDYSIPVYDHQGISQNKQECKAPSNTIQIQYLQLMP